jgi:hypothetical protein
LWKSVASAFAINVGRSRQAGYDTDGNSVHSQSLAEAHAYVDNDPLDFFDPDGRGKEGGQKNIGDNDPAMPRSVTQNSLPDVN